MRRALAGTALIVAVCLGVWLMQPGRADLVVYCAHDMLYAEPFFERFTRETGITVQVRYDTEATKSLGLTELIAAERDNPRCDVFWNNEPLGTIRLAEDGLLMPHKGSGFGRIPDRYKDRDGRWVGFGARLRVWIVHVPTVQPEMGAIEDRLRRPSLADVGIAKPLYGTTRSHVTALWDQSGPAAAKRWYADLLARGVRVVNGNSTVKNMVSAGTLSLGLTDTDDYFLAVDQGRPVAMIPATLPDGSTVCIPNTAAIVRGCKSPAAARRLVDYLTSSSAEVQLANAASRQIPLGPVDEALLPDEVLGLLPAARSGYVHRDQAKSSAACLAWLKAEQLR